MASTGEYHLEPTLLDKLMLIPHFGSVVLAVFFRLISRPFSNKPKPNTLFKDIVFTALRRNGAGVNAAQEGLITSGMTTDGGYRDFAKKKKFQPDTSVLKSGLKVHWVGPRNADKVLLFLHGGGYAMACSDGHFQWLWDLRNTLSEKTNIAIVIPAYELTLDKPAPKGRYPVQLQQATEALAWLLNVENKRPGDIFVAGDSAGGNMTLMLLSHLLHPHPEAPPIELSEPLASAILISPWTKFPADYDSIKRNETSDMVVSAAGKRWSRLFLGGKPKDNYNHPYQAPPEWWNGMETKVKDILVWGGGGEILIDGIIEFSSTLKAGHPKTELVVYPGGAHDDFIMEVLLGYKAKHEGTVLVENWIGARL